MRPQKRTYGLLAAATAAGLFGSVQLGQLAAQHVMRTDPPGGLAEADALARASLAGDRWWTESFEVPKLIPLPLVTFSAALAATPLPAAPASLSLDASEDAQPDIVSSSRASSGQAPSSRGPEPARASDATPPATSAEHAPERGVAARVPEQIAHAKTEFTPLPPSDSAAEHTVFIGKGDTLNDVLIREGATAPEAHDAVAAMRGFVDLRALKPGVELTLAFDAGEAGRVRLVKVSLPTGPAETVKVERGKSDQFSARKIAQPLNREVVRAAGVIRASLYEDAAAAGIPANLLAELIRAYSYDVDFQREIQPGDRFEVAYERFLDAHDKVAKIGNVIYAALTLSGHTLRIYRFAPKHGFADYFNEKGESVRKALLRTPIDGARITSGYGMRLHPILGYTTMHKGVDFGAPTGTPVMAAGEGVVESDGWRGNYGIYLRLNHNSEYSTAYAHMSAIARGIHPGSHVRQGQVIGYVGATGLATGPHLYYEVLVHNKQINPLSVRLPTGIKLAGSALKSFLAARAQTDAVVALLPVAGKLARTAF